MQTSLRALARQARGKCDERCRLNPISLGNSTSFYGIAPPRYREQYHKHSDFSSTEQNFLGNKKKQKLESFPTSQTQRLRSRGSLGSSGLYGSPHSSLSISFSQAPLGFNFSPRQQYIKARYNQAAAFPTVPTSSLTCVFAYWLISLRRLGLVNRS